MGFSSVKEPICSLSGEIIHNSVRSLVSLRNCLRRETLNVGYVIRSTLFCRCSLTSKVTTGVRLFLGRIERLKTVRQRKFTKYQKGK